MRSSCIYLLLLIVLLSLMTNGVYASDKLVPKEGKVFVGENDLDLSECNVRSGDEIAYWSSGSPEGVPDSRAKVMDSMHFYVDPKLFSGNTGVWYGLVSKKPVFTVEDPWIQLDVVETGLDQNKQWVKRGNLVSFKISTNMFEVSKRSGSAGVPVYINMTGPNSTDYSNLVSPNGEFNLKKIYVYYSPYDTGAVWQTDDISKYPDGEYSAKAFVDLNDILEKNPGEGITSSLTSTFLLNKTEPIKEKDKDKVGNEDKTKNSSSTKKTSKSDISAANNESKDEKIDKPTEKETPTPKVTTPVATEEPTMKPTPIETFEDLEEATYDFTPVPTKTVLPSPPKATPVPTQQPINPVTGIISVFAALCLLMIKRRYQ